MLDGEELVADGIEGCQDLQPLPSRWRLDKQALKAPEHSPKGRKDKLCGIHTEDGALARLGLR
jgi:hypothetical protein